MAKAKRQYGKGSIEPRGPNTWRLRYAIDGERYSKTSPAADGRGQGAADADEGKVTTAPMSSQQDDAWTMD